MKFLQILTFYPAYSEALYARHPALAHLPYEKQLNVILRDGFGALHYFGLPMRDLGWDSRIVLANVPQLQAAWMAQNNPARLAAGASIIDVLRLQIESFAPDVLFISDSVAFQSQFVRSLAIRPRIVSGWRAANIPPDTDWQEFDLILSHLSGCRKKALEHGAREAEFFYPGFPGFVHDAVKDQTADLDLIFCGQWTPEHAARNRMLFRAAMQARSNGWKLEYHLHVNGSGKMSSALESVMHSAKWGLDMFRTLRRGRISFNAEIDLAGGEAGNMRLFETTGVGAFLMTQHHANISRFFEPDREIVTFGSEEEFLEKATYYIEHDAEREAIAERGMRRCQTEHSLENRAAELDAILRKRL
ncbi:hypothetical protein PCS_00735 [Desulfocurvibacter africanus PCS]|uniref:Spore protein YkvP/CgeB glycosyl transferase-like domain-containing protein n=1 Tax=Desulfocurvibacter africanus PCS TaxID=1262666 RepID=M5PVS4_DESAF|nr:glycosyltransferase [Desulfocurvibacter africanus]EMG38437.1 hypothetical protein PCS_00735 [Desulfocurvibacter africanus PCS]